MNSYTYTPFGEPLTGEGSGFRFNGEYYDSATGMLNLRARQYEPSVMRFVQRDIWYGKVEMPTSQDRYLYCVNDPIGYYDHGGDRAEEGSGAPKKVTPSTSAKKVVATPKTPTPTPAPKTTPLPKPAPSPDTKFNANSSAKKSGNGWVKTLIGALTVTACVAIVVFSGGTAAPVMTPLAAWGLAFATGVATGITFSYGNNLMHQIDQTSSFKQASDNAARNTTNQLPYIIGGSALFAGAAAYTSTLTGGQIPTLGLKPTPFAASAFDDAVDDASGAYSGTQANGATQSGGAGTTACTEATNSLMSQDGEIFSPINPGPLTDDIANSFRSSTYTEKILTEDTVFYRVYGGDAQMVGNYMSRTPQNGGIQSQFDLGLNPTWGNTAESIVEVTVPKGTIIYEGSAAAQGINGGAGNLLGGGNQIYIPEARMNAPWFGN